MKLLHIATCCFLLSAVCAIESVESLLGRAGPGIPEDVIRKIGQDVRQVNHRSISSFSSILGDLPDGGKVLERLSGFMVQAETNDSVVLSTSHVPPNQIHIQTKSGTEYLASFERCYKASEQGFRAFKSIKACAERGPTLTTMKMTGENRTFVAYNGESWSVKKKRGHNYGINAFIAGLNTTEMTKVRKYNPTKGCMIFSGRYSGLVFSGFTDQHEPDFSLFLDSDGDYISIFENDDLRSFDIDEFEIIAVKMAVIDSSVPKQSSRRKESRKQRESSVAEESKRRKKSRKQKESAGVEKSKRTDPPGAEDFLLSRETPRRKKWRGQERSAQEKQSKRRQKSHQQNSSPQLDKLTRKKESAGDNESKRTDPPGAINALPPKEKGRATAQGSPSTQRTSLLDRFIAKISK